MTLTRSAISQHPNPLPATRERICLRLGENGALGADDHQWILYRGESPVSFVRSSKAVLVRCIREKGIELSAEGLAGLDALADGFAAWKADPSRKGTPIAAEALKARETRLMGDTTPSEGVEEPLSRWLSASAPIAPLGPMAVSGSCSGQMGA